MTKCKDLLDACKNILNDYGYDASIRAELVPLILKYDKEATMSCPWCQGTGGSVFGCCKWCHGKKHIYIANYERFKRETISA